VTPDNAKPEGIPRRTLLRAVALSLLGGCSTPPSRSVIDAALSGDPERIARTVLREELGRQGLPADLDDVSAIVRALGRLLQETWGEREPEVASERRYVKYSNAYQARAIVDFEQGWLQVETIAEDDPQAKLRRAIISTLLTDRDMRVEDIFSDAEAHTGGEPFLLGQVLDEDKQPIRWPWRAERFADHLLATVLRRERRNAHEVHSVRVALVDNHQRLRQLEYAEQVISASRQYRISAPLIYAVIEVESAFNTYAVSPANAFGLMQVVPATAGRDVYERVKKQRGEPTREQLFQPAFNIDIGSAYLHLLDTVYLQGIRDQRSRRFAMIAAYNGGPGSTLRAFDTDRSRALQRINSLSAGAVYEHLVRRHPFAETRGYLQKVEAAQQRYG
jgi:membrane-bound lytic murein transglycosylase C